jgi:hypothetical protein
MQNNKTDTQHPEDKNLQGQAESKADTQSQGDSQGEMVIKKLFSRVMTLQLENAEGSHLGCIEHVFQVWLKLVKDHEIDCAEHFEPGDGKLLGSLKNSNAQVLGVVVPYYQMFQEAVENDLVVGDFLMNVILPPHRTRAKKAVNRLAGCSVWP